MGFFRGGGKHLTKCVNVQFVDEVPQPFNHVLHLLHALPLKRITAWKREFLLCFSGFSNPGEPTHALVAEAHGAGFAFAEEEETAIVEDEGSAGAIFVPAANFTGVLRLCGETRGLGLYL